MYSVEDKKSSEKQLVSSIRCLHWMDCTSYNVQCALQAGMKSRIQFILFKLSQLITNFSLDVDVLKNFLRNMLNLWEQVLKVPNFPFVYQFRKNLESYCKQIKFRNHQDPMCSFPKVFILLGHHNPPPPSSHAPSLYCTLVYSCTVVYCSVGGGCYQLSEGAGHETRIVPNFIYQHELTHFLATVLLKETLFKS